MIPISLKIQGLYSYRGQVEIDFVKLAEGQLFGIFGAVGSGKSAILEAITFALYGQSERLNNRDNRNYNMMNLQSQEMGIEFEFMTKLGGEEKRFLFRVNQKRNSKRFEEVGSPKRSALQWKNGEWEPLETTDATEILNLSYENFTKTIIIPQGKFQEFLHLSATDRTRMLREIFALDRFELDQPTKALKAEASEKLVRLEEQLKPLEAASESEIQQKQLDLVAFQEELVGLKAKENQFQASVNQFRQLKDLSQKIAQTQAQYAQLRDQKSAFDLRAEALQRYQKARLEFSEILNQGDRIEKQLEAALIAFGAAEKSLAEISPKLDAAKLAQESARKAWEGRGELEAKIQDCVHLQAIQQAEAQIASFAERLQKGQEMATQVAESIVKAEAAIVKCDAALASNRKLMPDMTKVAAAQMWYQQKAQIEAQIAQIQEQIAATKAKLAANSAAQLHLAKSQNLTLAGDLQLASLCQHQLSDAKTALHAARTQRERIAHQAGLAAFSSDLKSGEPCPLCGSEQHPSPFDAGETNSDLDASALKIKDLEGEIANWEKALLEAQGLSIRAEESQKQIQQLEAEEAKLQARAKTHSEAFIWQNYNPEDGGEVEADRQAALKFQGIIQQEEELRKSLEASLKEFQANQKRFDDGLNKLKEERNRYIGQRETHLSQIAQLKDVAFLSASEAELAEMAARLKEELAGVLRAFEESQKTEKALEIQLAEWRQKLQHAETEQKQLRQASESNAEQLATKLAQSSFENLADLRKVLATEIDAEKEQAAIQAYQNQVLTLQTTLQTLEAQASAQKYDAAAHETAELALAETRQLLEAQQKAASLLQAEIAKLQTDFERRKALELNQAALQKRYDNLKILESMFKASGFVKYVSTIYLQELINRADVRFRKLTRNALSLELGDENDFLVRDMLNGGQTRSVKTLSGGQTFQASLCLALALADNVQQHSGSSHNFFFLDEGFGTLDKESLTSVFDALKQLRQENRTVGVISHVEDLQQEIETHLRVWQTEEKGSLVKGSWE